VSGSGISWATCKSAPRSRQITTPAPTTQFFTGWMPYLHQSTDGTLGFLVIYLYFVPVTCDQVCHVITGGGAGYEGEEGD